MPRAILLPPPPMAAITSFSVEVQVPTSGATTDVTISGMGTPKAYMTQWIATTAIDSATTFARGGVGVADGTNQRAGAYMSEHNQLSASCDTGFRYHADACAVICAAASEALNGKLSHNSYITDGVRLNIDTAPSSTWRLRITFFLGTDLNVKVFEYAGDATSGNSITLDTSGITDGADLLIGLSVYSTAATSTSGANAKFAFGAASRYGGIRQAGYTYFDEDRNATTTSIGARLYDDAFISRITVAGGTGTDSARHLISDWTDTAITIKTTNASVGFSVFGLMIGTKRRPVWVGIPDAATLNSDTTGNRTVTDWNFRGKYALGLSTPMVTKNTLFVANSDGVGKFSLGWSDGTVNGVHAYQAEDAAVTSNSHSLASSSFILGPLKDDTNPDYLASLTAFTATGATFNIGAGFNSAADRLALLVIISETQVLYPTGVASAEAVGTATLSERITLSPTGVASAQAIGAATVNATITLSPAGVASAQAVGTATIVTSITVSPTGVASAEAVGTATIATSITLAPSGVPSAEAIGTATVVTGAVTVSPSGVPSAEAVGTAAVSTAVTISPSGVPSAEAVGTATIATSIAVSPTGVASAEAVGTATVVATITISPAGVASSESVGTATVTSSITVSPSGVPSAEAVGTATIVATITISPAGVASAEAVGSPVIDQAGGAQTVVAVGVPSEEAVGITTVLAGAVIVSPSGVPSAESAGTPTVLATIILSPAGVASAEAVGVPTVTTGAVTVSPSGVPSAESAGTPAIVATITLSPAGVASAEAVGTAAVVATTTITASGVPSAEAVGTAAVVATITLLPAGIGSAEAVGSPTVVATGITIFPAGVVSAEAIGVPTVTQTGASTVTILVPGVASAEAVGRPFLTGGRIPTTMKKRIHDALCERAHLGTFVAATYPVDDEGCVLEQGLQVAPRSVEVNEVRAGLTTDPRFGTSIALDRSRWTWLMILRFDQEVVAELFERSLEDSPVVVCRDAADPTSRQARLSRVDCDYRHPPRGSPSNGTELRYVFEAHLTPR